MNLLDILIYLAATSFIVGWLIVILDALTGFKLIECIPSKIKDAFGLIHNGAFIAVAIILSAGLIWHFATG